MKYVVILGDGMADFPIKELGDKTPLQYAYKPNMDYIAKYGTMGLVNTVPENMAPGSDIANLSVMGYAPAKYYTGRSPLEAMNIGIDLNDSDVAIRCNFVTLSEDDETGISGGSATEAGTTGAAEAIAGVTYSYFDKTIIDYCADEITTEEANILIQAVNEGLGSKEFSFYTGTSYRNCMVWHNGNTKLGLTPPHDITGKKITGHFPQGVESAKLLELMEKSYTILKDHPVNLKRKSAGLKPANSIWLWGDGKKPTLTPFKDLFNVEGSMISAVDLLKGIALCAGLEVINVEGATGNVHTNYAGKAKAALQSLESGKDFVFIHIEAPDECGHRGELENKVKSIELIDKEILGFLLNRLPQFEEFKILLLPDHATPISLRTHTSNPVPYVIYEKGSTTYSGFDTYDEVSATQTGQLVEIGSNLMDIFLSK